MPSISIIIPTYKRNTSLLRTLVSLQEQKLDILEIIVVDNADDPQLYDEIIKFNRRTIHPISYISENKVGLHFARHTGAKVAKGEILLFTDDDATFHSSWANSYLHAFIKYENMVAAGGPVRPKWESDPPIWLKEFIGKSKIFTPLSLMDPYKKFRLDKKGYFFGVNMAVRKKTLFEVGGFNPELIGDTYVGDGEFGLIKKLWRKKLLMGFIPSALVYHQISKERMTLNYLKIRMKNEGISYVYGLLNNQIPPPHKFLFMMVSILFNNYKLWLADLYHRSKTNINALNIQLQAANFRGQLIYLFRLLIDKNLRYYVKKSDWLN